jgi:glucose-1-phosphate thymidylyltransferase
MKGVVLAGGLGTRWMPLTAVVNKHLLDVFDEPMVFYPIRTLVQAGVEDIVVVTGRDLPQFQKLLGDGSSFGAHITYGFQEGEFGIADALAKAKHAADGQRVVVILGDNIFQEDLRSYVGRYAEQPSGAKLLLKRVALKDATRFGVATFEDGRITKIVEKPSEPPSDLVVSGCYMYDETVWDIIDDLVPSSRGELEITDVNNAYIERGELTYDVLTGWWTDAGTPPSKLKASILVALAKGVTFHA